MNARSATPADIAIGHKLRLFRAARGMSQVELARALGITFQQVQKYERGVNRIGSGRLYEAATILEVPVSAFFEGLEALQDRAEACPDPAGPPEQLVDIIVRLAAIDGTAERDAALQRIAHLLDELER